MIYGIQEPVFTEIGSDFCVKFFRNTDETVNGTVNDAVKNEIQSKLRR